MNKDVIYFIKFNNMFLADITLSDEYAMNNFIFNIRFTMNYNDKLDIYDVENAKAILYKITEIFGIDINDPNIKLFIKECDSDE